MEIHPTFIRAISLLTFIYILRLIYTHKLRVGYSWFLFLLGAGFLLLSIWPDTISIIRYLTGDTSWFSNILFFFVIFLFIITVHCTVMISHLTSRVKELGQQLAILNSEIDEQNSLNDQMERESRADRMVIHIPPSSKQA